MAQIYGHQTKFQTLWKIFLRLLSNSIGTPHICSMNKVLTHMEAWNDFYEWMLSRKAAGEIASIPKDVQEAKYAAKGDRRHGLGEKRIKNLLTKYAPDRYRFEEIVYLLEK